MKRHYGQAFWKGNVGVEPKPSEYRKRKIKDLQNVGGAVERDVHASLSSDNNEVTESDVRVVDSLNETLTEISDSSNVLHHEVEVVNQKQANRNEIHCVNNATKEHEVLIDTEISDSSNILDHEVEVEVVNQKQANGNEIHFVNNPTTEHEDSINQNQANENEIHSANNSTVEQPSGNEAHSGRKKNLNAKQEMFRSFNFSKGSKWHKKVNFLSSTYTVLQILMMVYLIFARHSLTVAAACDVIKMVNVLTEDGNAVPESKYFFNLLFFDHLNEVTYHFYCGNCQNVLITTDSETLKAANKKKKGQKKKDKYMICENCKKTCPVNDLQQGKYYVTLPIKLQIQEVLERNWDYLRLSSETNDNRPDKIADLFDGEDYIAMQKKYDGNLITLTFNTDGVPLHNKNNDSFWPIQCIINELDVSVRYHPSNIILGGVWYGGSEPKMEIFLKDLIFEMHDLEKEGMIFRGKDNVERKITVLCLCTCLDSKAKPTVQMTAAFNGYYGCPYCKHKGTLLKQPNYYPIRFTTSQKNVPSRCNDEMRKQMHDYHVNNESEEGITGYSPFMPLRYFNICEGFVIDYMHAILLGVVKTLMHLWFDSSSHEEDYYVGLSSNKVDKLLETIKPPKFVGRLPRRITDRKFWKASEWKNFFLFYSIPLLSNIVRGKYLEHFSLLVTAIFLLLKDEISKDDLSRAENLLQEFVNLYELYYGELRMVFNIHLLLHLTTAVRKYGPLWAYSMFVFESSNGHLKKLYKGTISSANQIAKRFVRNKHVFNFFSYREEMRNVRLQKFCNAVSLYPKVKAEIYKNEKDDKIVLLQHCSFLYDLSEEEKQVYSDCGFPVPNSDVTVYTKFIKNKKKFHSLLHYEKRTSRRNDAMIKLKNGRYGEIQKIFHFDNQILLLVSHLEILYQFLPCAISWEAKSSHIKPCMKTNDLFLLDATSSFEKSILLEIDGKFYIADAPNYVESND